MLKRNKRPLTVEDKRMLFVSLFFFWSIILFVLAAIVNTGLDSVSSSYVFVMKNGTIIPRLSVVIAPVIEELVKWFGYALLLVFPLRFVLKLGYPTKNEFIDEWVFVAFLLIVGGFGFFEGLSNNSSMIFRCVPCYIAFVLLNALIHLTYSVYPFVFGRKYRNWFVVFLPIAIMLHAVHNFIIDTVWDNKWVTFTMVTMLLLPLLVLERKQVWRLMNCTEKQKRKHVLVGLGLLGYSYIFFCCLFAF
jgi:drug/metabolite transporter superfamily protein YnfA